MHPITDKPDIVKNWHLLTHEFATDPSPLPVPHADSSMIRQNAVSYSLAPRNTSRGSLFHLTNYLC